MKIEDQVCSFELAKRLKELGVKQESHFVWRSDGGNLWHPFDDVLDYERSMGCISAFTVGELGEILGMATQLMVHTQYEQEGGKWRCQYDLQKWVIAKTEADARAKMLVYLLEKKPITA